MNNNLNGLTFAVNTNVNFNNKKISFEFNAAMFKNATPEQFFQIPLLFRTSDGKELKLPIDPLVSVSSKNNIVKRNVQKQGQIRGTIKEYWNQEDYTITIAGVLMGIDYADLLEQQKALKEICETPEAIEVECEMLNNTFGVLKIVIESLDFAFTKGECNQTFTIKALSDESHELLI